MTLEDKDLSKLGTRERAKAYQHAQHQVLFGSLLLTGFLLALLALTPLGLLLRQAVEPFQNPWIQVQLYFLYFSLFFLIFDLPITFYQGFVLEKKFELSNHTVKSWLIDAVKKLVLSFAIASLLIQGFYFCIRVQPEQWWWISWLLYFGFSLIFTKIVPL